MKKIIIYILLFVPAMLFAQNKKEEKKEIDFDKTKEYINKKVTDFSIQFDTSNLLKIDSVAISEDGLVKLIYSEPKKPEKSVTFNINNLFKIKFSNDEGDCNCGITLNDGFITFWIKKDEGVAIRIQESEAKSVYKAFVNLIKVTKDKDLFAD